MRKVCGVGINDMKGKWCTGSKSSNYNEYQHRVYQLWYDMLRRAYKIYSNCKVCDRWLMFSNFIKDLPFISGYKKWLNKTGIKAWFLDKDSLYPGNRVYDPCTVVFISNAQSSREVSTRTNAKGAKAGQESCKRAVLATVNGVVIERDSLKEMSIALGVNYSTIRNWIKGKGINKYSVRYK